MIDINFILNGTRKPVKKSNFDLFSSVKKGKDPLANLMLKPNKGSIIGDRITKPQRIAMKRNPFTDWDKDGVINGLDCRPRNPKRHNFYEEAKKKFYQDFKEKGYYKYQPSQFETHEDYNSAYSFFKENPIREYVRIKRKVFDEDE